MNQTLKNKINNNLKQKNMDFKLNLIAAKKNSLRPALEFIKITNKHCTATNTCMLVRLKSESIFKDKINLLNLSDDDAIYIHNKEFAKLKKDFCLFEINKTDKILKFKHLKKEDFIFISYLLSNEVKGSYIPDDSINKVVDDALNSDLDSSVYCVNPEFLLNAFKSLGKDAKTCNEIEIHNKEKHVLLIDKLNKDNLCIVMKFKIN